MNQKKYLEYLFIALLLLIIYHAVFSSVYVYLDEINQLWLKNGNENFVMFATQGRWLTGVLFQKLFFFTGTIEELKWLRIFSLAGWIATSFCLYYLFQQWQKAGNWSGHLPKWMIIFTITSIPVAVFIGWASCMEMFLGVLFAALSSHYLFVYLQKQHEQYISIPTGKAFLTIMFGVISLFFYQSTFGLFLLPFLIQLYYTPEKVGKKQMIPLFFYLLTYVVYFGLFKFTLSAGNLPVSDRAQISFHFIDKIAFFFSGPLPTSFTFNYLYETQTLLPQVLAPLMLLLWVISVFLTYRKAGTGKAILLISVTIGVLACMYIPSLIAKENFPAYRTLFGFQLAVFSICLIQLEYILRHVAKRKYVYLTLFLLLTGLGYYNFNVQFITPLTKEYQLFHTHFKQKYTSAVVNVYFVRAGEKAFQKGFGIRSANDEIGRPSTSRDWVPEHLVKQTVFELTQNRETADKIKVVQFATKEEFLQLNPQLTATDMVIDMQELLVDK